MTLPQHGMDGWSSGRLPAFRRSQESRGSGILVICVYFGPLPPWLPGFLVSCEYNPEIDWLIITDADVSRIADYSPKNVRWLCSDIESVARLATRQLGFEIRLNRNHARKLCDLKPAYGLIFEEQIRNYGFWGHCDLDIVWGRIRHFITDDMLARNDIISSRLGKISGHFTIYRNTDAINGLVRDLSSFREIASQPERHAAFDEKQFTDFLRSKTSLSGRIVERLRGGRAPRICWDRILHTPAREQRKVRESENRVYQWVGGATFNPEGGEVMYVHFHLLKRTIEHYALQWGEHPSRIVISERRIAGMDTRQQAAAASGASSVATPLQ